MKILLVGKTGYFDTLTIALGYLNIIDINSCPYFADLEMENNKQIIKIGQHKNGDEIFVAGYKLPPIVKTISDEMNSLSQIQAEYKLHVIPLSVPGENTTYILIKLANIPIIGNIFLNWAKSRTISRRLMLYQMGECLSADRNQTDKTPDQVIAAKPYPEK